MARPCRAVPRLGRHHPDPRGSRSVPSGPRRSSGQPDQRRLGPRPLGALLWRLSPALRAWTATWDLAILVSIRPTGPSAFVFLFFWWIGSPPHHLRAGVAALGDIAVGIHAIPVTLAVARKTPGWQTRVRWLTVTESRISSSSSPLRFSRRTAARSFLGGPERPPPCR